MESAWTAWLLRVQLVLIAIMILGVVGHKFSLLPFKLAFPGFGLSLFIVFLCGLVGVVAIVLGYFLQHSEWIKPAWMAVFVGLVPVVVILAVVGPANLSVPPIHDISTDLGNPPTFSAAQQARAASDNSLEYGGDKIAEAQRAAYPDVQPIISDLSTADAFKRSLTVVEQMGWKLHDSDEATGIIEAYAETALFGFKDDVVIRVNATDEGSRVDLRSVSRVGQSDLGANAKRIMQFVERFEDTAKQ